MLLRAFVVVALCWACATTYTLTLLTDGPGTLTTANSPKSSYGSSEKVDLVATPDPGYKVSNWTGSDNDSLSGTSNSLNFLRTQKSSTVTVSFVPASTVLYTLTLGAPPHGTLSAAPVGPHYASGTQVALTAVPDAGFRVLSWTGTDDDSSLLTANTVTMSADRAVSVTFTNITTSTLYSLTLGTPAHGSLSAPSGPFAGGTVVTVTSTAATGYKVASWTGCDNDNLSTATNLVTMNADETVSALFTEASYTVGLSASTGGTLTSSPSGPLQTFGSTVTFTATAATGYRVFGWTNTDNDPSKSSSNTLVVQGDTTVSVVFQPIPKHVLMLAVAGNGSVGAVELEPGPGPGYYEGSVIHLVATPDSVAAGPPNKVTAWTGSDNDASVATMNTVTMNIDKGVTASFGSVCDGVTTYLLTPVVGAGAGSISLDWGVVGTIGALPLDNRFVACTDVAVTATATVGSGSYFSAWIGTLEQTTNSDTAKAAQTDHVLMYSDKTVTADFLP